MLDQAKFDLAVLHKLFEHAERSGSALPPVDLVRLFAMPVPIRRVEVALRELEARGDVEQEYHPHYYDEGLWQISRSGIEKVERLIRSEKTFVGRLHKHGDTWLDSDEAAAANLSSASPAPAQVRNPPPITTLIGKKVAQQDAKLEAEIKGESSVDWTKWGTVFGALSIIVSVLLWWLSK